MYNKTLSNCSPEKQEVLFPLDLNVLRGFNLRSGDPFCIDSSVSFISGKIDSKQRRTLIVSGKQIKLTTYFLWGQSLIAY